MQSIWACFLFSGTSVKFTPLVLMTYWIFTSLRVASGGSRSRSASMEVDGGMPGCRAARNAAVPLLPMIRRPADAVVAATIGELQICRTRTITR